MSELQRHPECQQFILYDKPVDPECTFTTVLENYCVRILYKQSLYYISIYEVDLHLL